jgi:hypothetical protein
VPAAELVRLDVAGRAEGGLDRGAVIYLANGDRLAARPVAIDELAVTAAWEESSAWPAVKVPLETVRAMVLDLPKLAAVRGELLGEVLARRAGSDAVFLRNGDRLVGTLAGLADGKWTVDGATGARRVDSGGVRAVVLDAELTSFPPLTGRRVLLTLTDGSWLTVTAPRLDGDVLDVKTAFGASLQIPLAQIAAARFLGGPARWLSEIEPAGYEFTPYLASEWPWHRDRNVLGRPLRLRGREYPLGVGLHSRSELAFPLDGGFKRLRGTLGIDDAAEGQGGVVFAVEADGRRVFESAAVGGRSDPLPLDVNITGAKQLTLVVEFGPLADVRDYADWCDLVLLP